MALCIVCSGKIEKPGGDVGGCKVSGCNNFAEHKGYEYCRQCANELDRCECCGAKQEKQHQIK